MPRTPATQQMQTIAYAPGAIVSWGFTFAIKFSENYSGRTKMLISFRDTFIYAMSNGGKRYDRRLFLEVEE